MSTWPYFTPRQEAASHLQTFEAPIPWEETDPFSISMYAQEGRGKRGKKGLEKGSATPTAQRLAFPVESVEPLLSTLSTPKKPKAQRRSRRTGAACKKARRWCVTWHDAVRCRAANPSPVGETNPKNASSKDEVRAAGWWFQWFPYLGLSQLTFQLIRIFQGG